MKRARHEGSIPGGIPRRPFDVPSHPSPAQQRLWFLNQLDDALCPYNVPFAIYFEGTLDPAAAAWALRQIVARHEVLRTVYPAVDGVPAPQIHEAGELNVEVRDAPGSEFDDQSLVFARTPFDLAADLPIRARIYRRSATQWVLALVLHHIAFDGASPVILLRELVAFYNAHIESGPANLSPLPIQYSDYAHWQRQRIESRAFEAQIEYWKQQLRDVPQFLALPLDRLRPARPSFAGDTLRMVLPAALGDRVREYSRASGTTLFMTFLAAFQVLLSRYCGQQHFVLGIPVAEARRPETESLIGFFTNTLPLAADVSGNPSFDGLLARIRQAALQAYEHAEVPFDTLIEALNPQRSPGHLPLIQVMFGFLDRVRHKPQFHGLQCTVKPLRYPNAKFDLYLNVVDDQGALELDLNYSADLFEVATVQRILEQFVALLQSAVATPHAPIADLSMLPDAQGELVRFGFNATQRDYPQERVHRLFERQVLATPDVIAVADAAHRWSYRELDRRANGVTALLRKNGIGRGDLVAVCVPRGVEYPAALLGILKAEAAYLPLPTASDASYPAERIAYLLRDAGAKAVLTSRELAGTLPLAGVPEIGIEGARTLPSDPPTVEEGSPDDLAYVMYTSGSTGVPNGVEVPHRGIVRLIMGSEFASLGPNEVFLQMAPVQFDASTLEIWAPLLTGGRLVFYPGRIPEAGPLAECIRRESVTTVWLTSTLYNTFIDETPSSLRGLRQLLIGGEALSVPHVRKGLELLPGTQLINGYGPTENTVFTCCYRIPAALPERCPSVPIGGPIANTRVYVLDEHQRLCPVGVPGEIAIGGDGLALGYRARPDVTATRFFQSPWGERLYRSGDIGRWREGGVIEFLGRADRQLKIRGHRIEPGEIEAALARCPGILSSVIVIEGDLQDERSIAAYAVGAPDKPTEREVQQYLARSLPAYMLPASVTFVSRLPVNENGKLDATKLPRSQARPCQEIEPGACTVTEWQLLRICKELLPDHPLGLNENLFDAGLHSLLAAKLAARVARSMQRPISLGRIFEYPTIAQLAAHLEKAHAPGEHLPISPIQPHGSRTPVFFLHAGPYLWPLAKRLERPVLGLQEPPGQPEPSLEAYATRHIETLRAAQPHGPYALGGWCSSGNLAYEMAQQLRAQGEEVALLILLDSGNYAVWNAAPGLVRAGSWVRRNTELLRFHARRWRLQSPAERSSYLRERLQAIALRVRRGIRRAMYTSGVASGTDESDYIAYLANGYRPQPYPGRVLLVRQSERPFAAMPADFGWNEVVGQGLEVRSVMGGHLSMFSEPSVETLAELLRSRLDDAFRDR